MEIVLASAGIFVGYMLGKLFVWQVCAFISVISLATVVYAHITMKEFLAFVAWIYTVCIIITNVAMWSTHYIVTEQSWLSVLFNNVQILK